MLKPKFMWPDAVRRRVWECREWFIESQVYTYSNTSLWSWVSLFFSATPGFFKFTEDLVNFSPTQLKMQAVAWTSHFCHGKQNSGFCRSFSLVLVVFVNLHMPWWLWLEWFNCVFLRWNSASYWNSGCFKLEHLAKCHDIFMEQQLRSLWMEVMLNGWHMKD